MNEYTPTTENVLAYIRGNAVMAGATAKDAQAAAVDWLASVERAAAARALEEAADALNLAPYTAIIHGSPHRWPYQSWLRARAAEIRGAK